MRHWLNQLWRATGTRSVDDPEKLSNRGASLVERVEAGRALPDDLIDAVLNEEIPTEESGPIYGALRREPNLMDELDRTEYVLDALKRASGGDPDLAGRILGEVHKRRGLLDRRGLRRVWVWRGIAAAGVVLAIASVLLIERISGNDTGLTAGPAPLSELLEKVPTARTTGANYLFSDAEQLTERVVPVVSTASPAEAPTVACSASACWCPYRNLLSAAGPQGLMSRWITLVAQETPRPPACTSALRDAPGGETTSGYGSLKVLYGEDDRSASSGVIPSGERLYKR